MANFVALIDARPQQRRRFAVAAVAVIAPVEGLSTSTLATGNLFTAWAVHPRVPVSATSDERGGAVVWGDALSDSGERLGAAAVREAMLTPTKHRVEPRDGYHAALAYDAGSDRTVAAADPLGVFPVYYWSSPEALLVGSSPELFGRFEGFREEISPAGLVGILLANNLVGGCSLLRGVRRLGAGCRLTWSPRRGAAEAQEYRPAVATGEPWRRLDDEVERLDAALASAVRRHAPPGEPHGLLLSGGRDSRMLAGYLERAGTPTHALTFGVRGEDDRRLARRAARSLGMEVSGAEVPDAGFAGFAATQARWEHLANGFSAAAGWGYHPLLDRLPARTVTGYLCDPIVGGSHIDWAYAAAGAPPTFESFFSRMNAWAVSPEALKRLLRPEVFGDGLVDEVAERIRYEYEASSESGPHRAWCFDLRNRQRFHVGAQLWRLSFGGWPAIPAADRGVLDAAAATNVSVLAGRVLQDALLMQRFPLLARIPLTGVPWPGSLRVSAGELARQGLSRAATRARRRAPGGARPVERYARLYDFNGPGWRSVRRRAETHRDLAHELFDPRALAELAPAPEATPAYADTIVGPAGSKLLVGLMLWAGRRLG